MVAVTSQSEPLPADIESRIGEFTELVATAIANAQSRETLAELAEEQAALRRVAMLVAHDAPPSEIFSAVSEEVARVFDSAAGVLQFEHGSAVVFVGVANIDVPVGARWEFQEGMTSTEVYRTGRPARVEGVDWSSLGGEVGEVSRRHGTRSIVGSPILVEGRLWGTIVVSSRHDLLPPDTEERLERFTDLIGTAIANAETRRTRAQLAEEQAALRRVATLVAEGVPAAELFSAVTKEVARVFSDVDPSLVASVIRFDPGPESVLVGASRPDEREPIGSRWAPKDLYVSTRVLRTGGCARVDEADLEAMGGSDADVLRLRGFLHQVGSPVVVEGRLWGSMTLNSTEALPPDVDQRLASFVDLVATAIANADSRSELAASRKRLVAASDEARRRIERDLHDGTQQRLVSLALAARAAEAQLPTESRDVREKFSKIAIGLAQAVEELQELSRGIHPAILSDAGLGPALEALALRSPIPVELRVHTQERYPEPVEVAAYFVASESLANAAKHSQASHIDVALTLENGRLLLSVCDDGIGGADPGRGSGLVGLRDRVEAVGGSLEIKSESGDGTLLVATLPIRDELGADADRFP
jgi:signal transduction histidine kinase